jgi:hypothetical protein
MLVVESFVDPISKTKGAVRLRKSRTSERVSCLAEANHGAFGIDLILSGPQLELSRLGRPRWVTARRDRPPPSSTSPQRQA